MSELYIYLGFAIAAYSVIGNDVIQTLGTFISSNSKRPWYFLFAFAGTILAVTLIYGWATHGGDVSYGRLIGDPSKMCGDLPCSADNPKYPFFSDMSWWFLLPPIVLLFVTRFGIPVSTSFLILTFFQPKGLSAMLTKSLMGYVVAFGVGLVMYLIIARLLEKRFRQTTNEIPKLEFQIWTVLQWCSTGYLWSLWLIQDFANIYVYLPRSLSALQMGLSLLWLLGLLAYIFWSKGGAIQGIVNSKSGTSDIRSATIIDFLYSICLLYFTMVNPVPMSTTWVFIGLLAGRELGIRLMLDRVEKKTTMMILKDIGKAAIGLIISILLVWFINLVKTGEWMMSFQ